MNYLKKSRILSLGVILTHTPQLAVGVFSTTYFYYNTILDGELPLVVTSNHTVINTITRPDDYISFLQPSEEAIPVADTNTYYSQIILTNPLNKVNGQNIYTAANIVQVIVTESQPLRSASVLTSYYTDDTLKPKNLLKGIEATGKLTDAVVAVTTDYVAKNNNQKEGANHSNVYDMHIYATKTFITTYTYYTSSLVGEIQGGNQHVTSSFDNKTDNWVSVTGTPSIFLHTLTIETSPLQRTVIKFHTRIIKNVITESVQNALLQPTLISMVRAELFKMGKNERRIFVTTATLKGDQILKITAMNMLEPMVDNVALPTKTIGYVPPQISGASIPTSATAANSQPAGSKISISEYFVAPKTPPKVVLPSPTNSDVNQKPANTQQELKKSTIQQHVHSIKEMQNFYKIKSTQKPYHKPTQKQPNKKAPSVVASGTITNRISYKLTKANGSSDVSESDFNKLKVISTAKPSAIPQLPMAISQLIGSFNPLQALRPVFDAMAGLLQSNFQQQNNNSNVIKILPSQASLNALKSKHKQQKLIRAAISQKYTSTTNHTTPPKPHIYIPVQNALRSNTKNPAAVNNGIKSLSLPQSLHIQPPQVEVAINDDNWLQESSANSMYYDQYIQVPKQSINSVSAAVVAVQQIPLLNSGIPIRPGEVIIANTDVIVGKPIGSTMPRAPSLHSHQHQKKLHKSILSQPQTEPENIKSNTDGAFNAEVTDGLLSNDGHLVGSRIIRIADLSVQLPPNAAVVEGAAEIPTRITFFKHYNQHKKKSNEKQHAALQQQILMPLAQELVLLRNENHQKHNLQQARLQQSKIILPQSSGHQQQFFYNGTLKLPTLPAQQRNRNTQIEKNNILQNYNMFALTPPSPSPVKTLILSVPAPSKNNLHIMFDSNSYNNVQQETYNIQRIPEIYRINLLRRTTSQEEKGTTAIEPPQGPQYKHYSNHQHINLETHVLSHSVDINVPPLTFKKETDFPHVQAIHGQIPTQALPSAIGTMDRNVAAMILLMPHVKIPLHKEHVQMELTPHNVIGCIITSTVHLQQGSASNMQPFLHNPLSTATTADTAISSFTVSKPRLLYNSVHANVGNIYGHKKLQQRQQPQQTAYQYKGNNLHHRLPTLTHTISIYTNIDVKVDRFPTKVTTVIDDPRTWRDITEKVINSTFFGNDNNSWESRQQLISTFTTNSTEITEKKNPAITPSLESHFNDLRPYLTPLTALGINDPPENVASIMDKNATKNIQQRIQKFNAQQKQKHQLQLPMSTGTPFRLTAHKQNQLNTISPTKLLPAKTRADQKIFISSGFGSQRLSQKHKEQNLGLQEKYKLNYSVLNFINSSTRKLPTTSISNWPDIKNSYLISDINELVGSENKMVEQQQLGEKKQKSQPLKHLTLSQEKLKQQPLIDDNFVLYKTSHQRNTISGQYHHQDNNKNKLKRTTIIPAKTLVTTNKSFGNNYTKKQKPAIHIQPPPLPFSTYHQQTSITESVVGLNPPPLPPITVPPLTLQTLNSVYRLRPITKTITSTATTFGFNFKRSSTFESTSTIAMSNKTIDITNSVFTSALRVPSLPTLTVRSTTRRKQQQQKHINLQSEHLQWTRSAMSILPLSLLSSKLSRATITLSPLSKQHLPVTYSSFVFASSRHLNITTSTIVSNVIFIATTYNHHQLYIKPTSHVQHITSKTDMKPHINKLQQNVANLNSDEQQWLEISHTNLEPSEYYMNTVDEHKFISISEINQKQHAIHINIFPNTAELNSTNISDSRDNKKNNNFTDGNTYHNHKIHNSYNKEGYIISSYLKHINENKQYKLHRGRKPLSIMPTKCITNTQTFNNTVTPTETTVLTIPADSQNVNVVHVPATSRTKVILLLTEIQTDTVIDTIIPTRTLLQSTKVKESHITMTAIPTTIIVPAATSTIKVKTKITGSNIILKQQKHEKNIIQKNYFYFASVLQRIDGVGYPTVSYQVYCTLLDTVQ